MGEVLAFPPRLRLVQTPKDTLSALRESLNLAEAPSGWYGARTKIRATAESVRVVGMTTTTSTPGVPAGWLAAEHACGAITYHLASALLQPSGSAA